jgi:hypothetical protein
MRRLNLLPLLFLVDMPHMLHLLAFVWVLRVLDDVTLATAAKFPSFVSSVPMSH